ncbi:hypothetical protein [Micromonospora sp. Llam0]|uniref:hypothetical protein n=1 Tax=Micromonospora sp. Llam0 TaxID=2485143 RepID=UPI0011CE6342|nr:hypothetical protein [Micromonospora sp. Llam0]
MAAAFLAVPRWAGVAFLGEVARCTRPAVRFVAAATFFPARPVVPLAGVDLVGLVVAVLFAAVLLPAVAVLFAGLVFLAGLVFVAAGLVLRAVVVVRFAAGLLLLAAVFFAVGLVLRAVGLVFFVAGAFAVADAFRADVFFAAELVLRAAGLVLPAAVFVVAVLDARRVAGRVAALVPATMAFSSSRTFSGFVPHGDNGVSGIRPRWAGPA